MVLSQTHSHEGPAQLLHGQLREWSRTYCVARQLKSHHAHLCNLQCINYKIYKVSARRKKGS